jgi:hypothetical protein
MKTTWEIVKKETGNKNCSHKVHALEVNNEKILIKTPLQILLINTLYP